MDGADAMRHVKELFYEALRVAESERDSFLARACAADPSMRLRVLALLRAHDDAGSFLTGPDALQDVPHGTRPE